MECLGFVFGKWDDKEKLYSNQSHGFMDEIKHPEIFPVSSQTFFFTQAIASGHPVQCRIGHSTSTG